MNSSKWLRVSPKRPCAICNKNHWCSYADDGSVELCYRVKRDDARIKKDKSGTEYYLYFDPTRQPTKIEKGFEFVRPLPDNQTLHLFYGAFLSKLTLCENHRQHLTNERGFADDEIKKLYYKSVPQQERFSIIKQLLTEFSPSVVASIPGFYFNETAQKPHWNINARNGIIIPVRNAGSQIIALKIRSDEKFDDTRYRYFSSSSKGGNGSGSHVHVPLNTEFIPEIVRVTEGELKADYATLRTGVLTLSVPGVQAWRNVVPVIADFGAKKIKIAFDDDAQFNAHVARALASLYYELKNQEILVEVETWNN